MNKHLINIIILISFLGMMYVGYVINKDYTEYKPVVVVKDINYE